MEGLEQRRPLGHAAEQSQRAALVVSCQHDEGITSDRIRADLEKHLLPACLPAGLRDAKTVLHVNPTGAFSIGGPKGDTGLTGRKIIVDTYGGWASHGGGAFSGKDPSKVDRSAAYIARYVAKNVVASGVADACEIQLAYVIGVAEPASLRVRAEGWGRKIASDAAIERAIRAVFKLTPAAIAKHGERFVVRGGPVTTLEGRWELMSAVV